MTRNRDDLYSAADYESIDEAHYLKRTSIPSVEDADGYEDEIIQTYYDREFISQLLH